MTNLNPGEILSLVGLLLLLVHNMLRRQVIKARKPVRGLTLLWLRWGDLAVFLVILAGITLMWASK